MQNPAGYISSEMILQKFSSQKLSDTDYLIFSERLLLQIYVSKLNWYKYTVNELFIIIFPTGLDKDLPIIMY